MVNHKSANLIVIHHLVMVIFHQQNLCEKNLVNPCKSMRNMWGRHQDKYEDLKISNRIICLSIGLVSKKGDTPIDGYFEKSNWMTNTTGLNGGQNFERILWQEGFQSVAKDFVG